MPRIQSSSDPGGGSPYEFTRNPTDYLSQDDFNADKVDVLHGAPVWQRKKWDGRPRTFIWRLVGATSTVNATDAQLIDEIRTWVGTVRYFNFNNLDRVNENWPVSVTWKKCRIIDLKTNIREGGRLYYETVRLVIQPEEA